MDNLEKDVTISIRSDAHKALKGLALDTKMSSVNIVSTLVLWLEKSSGAVRQAVFYQGDVLDIIFRERERSAKLGEMTPEQMIKQAKFLLDQIEIDYKKKKKPK